MNIILLPGNSPRNKAWITHIANSLRDDFGKIIVQEYEHWSSGQPLIDFEVEQSLLARSGNQVRPFVIFAKSVGGIVALKATAEDIIMPENIIITGLPLSLIRKKHIPVDNWLHHLQLPITIIQNEQDPVGSYDDIITYIRPINNSNIVVVPHNGSSHSYSDIEHIRAIILATQPKTP